MGGYANFYNTLFAVFCTVDVPASRLDALINSIRARGSASAISLIDSINPSHYRGGTRASGKDFKTPFKGKTVKELRALYEKNFIKRPFGECCFIVLDERFLADGTVLLVQRDEEFDTEDEEELEEMKDWESYLNFRCDGSLIQDILICWTNNHDCYGRSWHDDDWDGADAGAYVLTVEEFDDRNDY